MLKAFKVNNRQTIPPTQAFVLETKNGAGGCNEKNVLWTNIHNSPFVMTRTAAGGSHLPFVATRTVAGEYLPIRGDTNDGEDDCFDVAGCGLSGNLMVGLLIGSDFPSIVFILSLFCSSMV